MPEVDNSGIIDIKSGRHPVIEKMLGAGAFIDNDTYLDKEENRLSIITGPKYGWKINIYETSSINNLNGTSRKFCTSSRSTYRCSR